MVAKVADFGFSRDVYISDYYKLDHPALLPVKWLAPEALFDKTFNMKTDVVCECLVYSIKGHYFFKSNILLITHAAKVMRYSYIL